jgi:hypothetical protein
LGEGRQTPWWPQTIAFTQCRQAHITTITKASLEPLNKEPSQESRLDRHLTKSQGECILKTQS